MKKIDLVGERIGKLVITQDLGKKGRERNWQCQCDCGTIVERVGTSLKNSKQFNKDTTSCGCLKQVQLDTTRRYGWLLPLRSIGKDKRGYFAWELECICGKIVVYDVSKVNTGLCALHCGCRNDPRNADNPVSMIGQRFGKLEVISYHSKNKKSRNLLWNVRCDCGNTAIRNSIGLRKNGENQNCGCITKRGNRANYFKGSGEVRGDYFSRLKKGAEFRSLDFNITVEMIEQLFKSQNGKCALSGTQLELAKGSKQTASLDRIDSTKGYDIDNIQWVHKTVNRMKLNVPEDEFVEWCRKIAAMIK